MRGYVRGAIEAGLGIVQRKSKLDAINFYEKLFPSNSSYSDNAGLGMVKRKLDEEDITAPRRDDPYFY